MKKNKKPITTIVISDPPSYLDGTDPIKIDRPKVPEPDQRSCLGFNLYELIIVLIIIILIVSTGKLFVGCLV